MKLTDLFSAKTNIENSTQPLRDQPVRITDGARQLQSLTPGQTLQGEVVSRKGSEVQLRLGDDMLLNARVDKSIHLDLGRLLTFEVKNNGAALTLSPLFTNVATDVTTLKALDMAGLPVNDSTVAMTEGLMKAGLPVSREELQQVYREIISFSEKPLADIVNLHRLQLPVNEANLEQMAAYRNLTYQLGNAMDTVLSLLPSAAEKMVAEGENQAAVSLYRELFAALAEPAGSLPAEAEGFQGETLNDGAVMTHEEQTVKGVSVPSQEASTGILQEEPPVEQLPLTDTEMVQVFREEPGGAAGEVAEQKGEDAEAIRLLNEQLRAFSRGETDGAGLLAVAKQLLKPERMSAILKNREFQGLLGEQLRRLWSIRPEDVAEPEKVSELYRRLDRQLSGITRALEEGGQAQSGACKAAVTMSGNIDFLQQLNQMYAYVQLPLQLRQGRAHGDLYVYTNKKSLASADGRVSALLHLDMEHLGPVDVYVTLQNTKVNTRFYVQDEEMLEFLEQHMELLTERLSRRGYDCSYAMTADSAAEGEGRRGLAPLLQQERGLVLSQYAFDVRT